ncbi:hypothetical protein RclHR1_06780005 [Rhizophagus clarus]|uniref:Uncharacterized protein n=1 Tax=Rhizophagus clarus TaxID=94130 RepID=A0A2Z6RVN5_9GLOM|nr:hypothetical protein RclHR1_06780005 [Rhizophagus clarus]
MSTSEAELTIPYEKYFEFFPAKVWSLQHFSKMFSEYYEVKDRRAVHNIFYKILKSVANDQSATVEVRNTAKELIERKIVSAISFCKILHSLFAFRSREAAVVNIGARFRCLFTRSYTSRCALAAPPSCCKD